VAADRLAAQLQPTVGSDKPRTWRSDVGGASATRPSQGVKLRRDEELAQSSRPANRLAVFTGTTSAVGDEREESLNVLAFSAACTLRSMDDKSVRKLHGLYQVIEPLHDKQCERALVVVSQLHRKPPSKRAITGDASGSGAPQGELEWVVGLAGPGKPDPDAKGKKREPADEWWESRLSSDEIAEWLDEVRLPRSPAIGQLSLTRVGRTQADAPHQDPPALLAKLRLAWENGELHVKGYAGPGADPRMGLEVGLEYLFLPSG
jgi:hypothetical protein